MLRTCYSLGRTIAGRDMHTHRLLSVLSVFLLMGVLTAFVATTAPELQDPETLIKTSCAELGKGRIASIIKNFEGGRLEIAYDPEHFVFSFDVRRQ